MKNFCIAPAIFLFSFSASAQTASFCDADFSCNPSQIVFTTNPFSSWGDSMVSIPISNFSGLNYAYPQAKLFNTTPLPAGMTQNATFSNYWFPYASSWNNNDTAMFNCGYDISQPIPANYMVTFRLWLRPNDTAVGYDSCVFSQDFTLNLNPQTGIDEPGKTVPYFSVFPNPSDGKIAFKAGENTAALSYGIVADLSGRAVFSFTISAGGTADLSTLPGGFYLVQLYDREGEIAGKSKLVKE